MSFASFVSQWQGVIYLAGNLVFGLLAVAASAKFTPRKEHEVLKERVAVVESRISNMPDTKTIHALSLQLTELKGELKGIPLRFERVDAVAVRLQKQVDRVEEFLDQRGA